ncbi:MAG: hypothetical protein K2N44_12295 [Lachnospiraceae bacterium]|nr:hypothetical protein [Lachnospiraceae bacterium]
MGYGTSYRLFSVSQLSYLLYNNGLIPIKELTVSGDGTAVKAHAVPFGRNPRYLKSPLGMGQP